MDKDKALMQLKELERLAKELRLAADGWDEDWKCLIATLMSARTTDRKTIPVATELFEKFNNVQKLAKASVAKIAKIIKQVNFYKTKARHIKELAEILIGSYNGKVPHEFDKLVELPGVGRKTANVFLAEVGHGRIGVDTHVSYISHYLGWTSGRNQEEVEKDLEELFPKEVWGDLNWILVRFGQTYRSRVEKNRILDKIRKI